MDDLCRLHWQSLGVYFVRASLLEKRAPKRHLGQILEHRQRVRKVAQWSRQGMGRRDVIPRQNSLSLCRNRCSIFPTRTNLSDLVCFLRAIPVLCKARMSKSVPSLHEAR